MKLRSRLKALCQRDHQLTKQIADLMLTQLEVRDQIEEVQESLADILKTPEAHVTDHAVVRYLERIDGVDISAVRNKILGGYQGKLIDGQFPLETHRIRVSGGVVVTVLKAKDD